MRKTIVDDEYFGSFSALGKGLYKVFDGIIEGDLRVFSSGIPALFKLIKLYNSLNLVDASYWTGGVMPVS